MKDRLGKAKWWNAPIKNPTQTRYLRFLKTPTGKLKSQFTDISDEFKNKSLMKDFKMEER